MATATATKPAANGSKIADETTKATEAAFDRGSDVAAKVVDASSQLISETYQKLVPTVEDAVAKTRDFQTTWAEQSKAATAQFLDVYEAGVVAYLDWTKSLAQSTGLDWLIELTSTNAQRVDELTSTYAKLARELVSK